MSAVLARRLLFCVSSAALLASAAFVLLGAPGRPGGPSGGASPRPRRVARVYAGGAVAVRRTAGPVGLRRRARRFVAAFLRYEVGSRDAAISRALRSSSTPSFGRSLLSSPAAAPVAGAPRAAKVRSLSLRPLSGHPPVALVAGTARRPGGAERFSFLFVETKAGWRAFGPGE